MINGAQQYLQDLLEGSNPARSYKAPHAPRGTPKRGHLSRKEERARLEIQYREGLKKPQPEKYLNRAEKERRLLAGLRGL